MKKLLKSVAALSLSAMMLLSPGVLAEEDEEESNVVELTTVVQEYEGKQIVLKTAGLDILEQDGYKFKDLNKNGELDPYEDWRLTPEERTEDLLSRMSDKNKAAQMAHMTLVTLKESWFSDLDIGFALTYTYFAESKESAGEKMNYVQSLCEESELGIPVVFSMDSVIGASWINDTTILPDAITLGATGDAELVQELADIQRQEMKALGVRMSLSPNADLATDPRWGRNQETYGEDANTAKAMVVAAITGLQNGTDGIGVDSVMSCVKHFPGSGPQTGGVDGSPLVFDDETFALHLSIFEAALTVHPASIMPYGYSTVPYLGGDAVENYAHESSVVMNDVLRGRLGYDGIIQTDWGLNHIGAMQAGADVMGVMGQRGSEEHYQKAMEAAEKAVTLVKYENQQPLEGQQILVVGALAKNVDALSSGWKISSETGLKTEGKSIYDAICERAGADNVTYIGDDETLIADSYPAGTTAIVVVGEASGTHEPAWGTATLEFPAEQQNLLKKLDASGVNVVSVVLMNRAYVMTPVDAASDAVMIVYRPGVTAGAEAVAHALFGDCAISGKLPWQIPATMDQVMLQREDLPKDIENPLYDYGFGIEVAAFGQ